MQAARFHSFGGPEVLRLDEVAWPWPQGDEVLIRVHASSVNGTDLGMRRGDLPGFVVRRPFTVGLDVAGEVVGLGPGVTALELGDRVYSLLGHGGGGAAEYVKVRQARVARAPVSVSPAEAAAVPLAGLTALQALRAGAGLHLRRGARVLVNGAAGGIGAFGVQLARHYGASVTATARPEKHDFVRGLGAEEVLDPAELDPAELDLGRAAGRWDVIFDTPPALDFARVRGALAPGGVFVSTRPFPTSPASAWATLGGPGPRFSGVQTKERAQDLALLARLIDGGALRVPLDRTFALAQIAQAHRYAEGRGVRGKVVVTLD
ncbi:NADP-dependent oxidoreductase [Deinococcus budaensis]|uniref:NADPH:quinone reductase-like Zn-dependent oxidoreductase n=1 Tax=Deinococcus budaensis TaxID=1665626 RepID=A0A7W8GES9_9DEIO|nr:NADP-dependent oxidoreductase [Deinococcus budaensis]MBB5234014.1 NADPH:quinone reductase-like Zn-dependent oxidoreductase [Deinococcus budaensis]